MTTGEDERGAFLAALRTALMHLYDPVVLRASPLVALFGLEARGDRASALQRQLTEAIEACRPPGGPQTVAGNWRAYQVLRRRCIEQASQADVAADLGLSVRQLQREEKLARELLADQLWRRHDLDILPARRAALAPQLPILMEGSDDAAASTAQELAWIRESIPTEVIDVDAVARQTLDTAATLLQSLWVRVRYTAEPLPLVAMQPVVLSQGLLNALTAAARAGPGGSLRVNVGYGCAELRVTVTGRAASDAAPLAHSEELAAARQLAEVTGGSLALDAGGPGEAFAIMLRLPVAEQAPVLIVDDNADAHLLYQRFLAGTRFLAVGQRDPVQAVALAEQVRPCAVLLDVMMPGQDGWSLLGRLREHPQTRAIPVIVCTILPQEDLALSLGAAEFLRKPISRATLLAALERCTVG
jgi:CheY-like chemotaxis protein